MKTTAWVVLCMVAALASGCQKSVLDNISRQLAWRTQPGQTTEPQYLYHTVQRSGETLSHVAQWYTGKIQHWETIAAHNRSLDLNTLRQGDRIRIPESILITHQAMPQGYVQELTPKEAPAAVREPAQPPTMGAVPRASTLKPAAKPPEARQATSQKVNTPKKPPARTPSQPPAAVAAAKPGAVPRPAPKPEQFRLLEPVESISTTSPDAEASSAAELNEIELFGPIP